MTTQAGKWIGKSLLALLVITAASCEDPRAALIRGHVASVKGNEITITPLQPREPARPLVLSMDEQNTTILARRVESGTMTLERADRADLVVGREVAVTTYGRHASIIRVFPPKPVGGRVASVDGGRLTISLDDVSAAGRHRTAQFVMSGQARILLKTIEATAPVPASVADLKPGKRVFVYAQGNDAVAVKMVPEPPVVGSVVRIDGSCIVIRPARNGEGPAETMIPYRPNLARAVVQYFGTNVTAPASLSDIKPGTHAAVYLDENGAVAMKFVSVPLRGRLLAVDSNSIMFQADGQSTASQRYLIIPGKTAVNVSRPAGMLRGANGRPSTRFASAPGTFRDLHPGQRVLLSAADNALYAVNVMPISSASSHDSRPPPERVPQ